MTDLREIAVVTGGAGDIGQAIALKLAERFRIAVADIDATGAQATVLLLGGDAFAVPCDVSDAGSVSSAAATISGRGRVAVLVNNAGAAADLSLHRLTEAGMMRDLDLNLAGAIRMFKSVETDLIAAQGCLINIASVNGIGTFGHPAYSAAKAGLIQFTRSVAVEYGRYCLRANTVAPGTVQTRAWAARRAANPAVMEEAAAWYPLGRVATTQDVADAVGFLVSAQAITGICLPVDCGLTAGQPAMAATFTQTPDFTG